MCLVEIENSPKPVAACAMPVSPNMRIFTDSPFVKKAREGVLELLLLNHPLDCPICDQGGECDLQDQVLNFGSDRSRFFEMKRTVEDKNCGPFIKTIMTRCIHCTRCVRFSEEVEGKNFISLGTVNRGQQTEISTYIDKLILHELSGNLIDLCPVGALTSKPYAFVARPWELKFVDFIDTFDSLGTSISINLIDSKIVRVLPKFNRKSFDLVSFSSSETSEWITDKVRFSYDGFYRNRLNLPFLLVSETYHFFSWNSIISLMRRMVRLTPSKISFIVSNTLDSETLLASKLLTNHLGISKFSHDRYCSFDFTWSGDYKFDVNLINEVDSFFLVGTNPKLEASLLNLQISQNCKKKDISCNTLGSITNSVYSSDKFIGLSLPILFSILEGKHKVSKESYNKLNSSFLRLLILFGSSVFDRFDTSQFFNSLKLFGKKKHFLNQLGGLNYSYKMLPTEVNAIGSMNLGINSLSPECFKNNLLMYLVHPEKELLESLDSYYKVSKTESIVIYHGSHMINLSNNGHNFINYFIPGSVCLEKEGSYFNLENKCQKTSKIITTNIQGKEESNFFRLLDKKRSFNYDLSFLLDQFVPKYSSSKFSEVVSNYPNFLSSLSFFYGVKLKKSLLKLVFENFFLTNVICQNSLIMGKASNLTQKNSTNFLYK